MLTVGYLVTDPDQLRERAESIRFTANSLNDADVKARMLKFPKDTTEKAD